MNSIVIRMASVFILLSTVFSVPLYAQDWVYTTRPGDNLWDLSKKYLSSMSYWRKLQALNDVENPREMPPGTQLRMPIAWLKVQPVSVKVLTVTGKVFAVSGKDSRIREVTENTLLYVGDKIHTESNGSAVLLFADGSQLLLQSNSQLKMNMIRAYGETGMVDSRVRLNSGSLDTRVVPSKGPEGRFEVHTPGAISAVRGTQFRISSNLDEQTSMTEVITGRVDVSAAGEVQIVSAGFGTVVKTGQPPLVPRELLPSPDLSEIKATFSSVPLKFAWPELKDARSYRIQVAPDNQFLNILADETTQTNQYIIEDLSNGAYAIRIRGLDALNLGGKDAVHQFVVDKRPNPPQLLGPEDQSLLREKEIKFHWGEEENVTSYRFQLADNVEFSLPIVDAISHKSTYEYNFVSLEYGQYYWRVAAAQESEKFGEFSSPHSFRLRAPLISPQLEAPIITDKQVILSWQNSAQAKHYEYELAKDVGFEDIVTKDIISAEQLTLSSLSSGEHYFRVRVHSEDNEIGPYSEVQSIDIPYTNDWPLIISITITFIFYLL